MISRSTRAPSSATYYDNLRRHALDDEQILEFSIPLWEAGCDSEAITEILNREHGALIHPANVANALARWRDGKAGEQ